MKKMCPYTGVNRLRLLLIIIVGFLFFHGSGILINGYLLESKYALFEDLWRSAEEAFLYYPLVIAAQFLIVVITAFMFTQNYEDKGILEGVRFGILIGLLFAIFSMSPYVSMPVPLDLMFIWAGSAFFKAFGLGIIYALFYRGEPKEK
jgi:hypothetical protein